MPRDHLQAEIERLRARIARDTLDLVRLEQMQAERRRLQDVPTSAKMGRMEAATESRALKISKAKTRRASAEVLALRAAGLTPQGAAEICGTTRDVLKQSWAKGKQFRPMKDEWAKKLQAHGVPLSTWRKE